MELAAQIYFTSCIYNMVSRAIWAFSVLLLPFCSSFSFRLFHGWSWGWPRWSGSRRRRSPFLSTGWSLQSSLFTPKWQPWICSCYRSFILPGANQWRQLFLPKTNWVSLMALFKNLQIQTILSMPSGSVATEWLSLGSAIPQFLRSVQVWCSWSLLFRFGLIFTTDSLLVTKLASTNLNINCSISSNELMISTLTIQIYASFGMNMLTLNPQNGVLVVTADVTVLVTGVPTNKLIL